MKIDFWKYQGTGNDFIMLDGRNIDYKDISSEKIRYFCHRRFGIGADGLIVLENSPKDDFVMRYYNSDGNLSSMCGNGGRCITRFAYDLGIKKERYMFSAIDGRHESYIEEDRVFLRMSDVKTIEKLENHQYFLDTGSPHYIAFRKYLPVGSIVEEARIIRNSETYKQQGVNVNFVALDGDFLKIRTYERGVEDETLSCGTGVTAAVIAAYQEGLISGGKCMVKTPGGTLELKYKARAGGFTDIWLIGPAEYVFKGQLEI
jgi:diaminopimelate epimerase